MHIPEFKFQNHHTHAVTVSNLLNFSELHSVFTYVNGENAYSAVAKSNEMRTVLST